MRTLGRILTVVLIFNFSAVYAGATRVGTTFSPKQCEYFGEDWKRVYLSVLDQGFEIIRLGAYWSRIEKEKDVYDFGSLDWQIKEAEKRNIKVLLTVGMKAPRWPEYYIPNWVLEKARLKYGQNVSEDPYLRAMTLKFVSEVVKRYEGEPAVAYWQVENEPFDRSGANYWWIGKDFLKEELELVKRLDRKKRPVVINMATYPNAFLSFIAKVFAPVSALEEATELCDILGLNIYPTVGHEFLKVKMYFRTKPETRLRYFSRIVNFAESRGKKVWVTELQAEPWEPGELVYTGKEEPLTISPDLAGEVFGEVVSLGVKTVFLWGAEYWYYRNEHYSDKTWQEEVKKLLD